MESTPCKVEDDAAVILADGKPVVDDLGGAGSGVRAGILGFGEKDAGAVVEAVGKVGKKLGEELPFAALGAQKVGEHGPLGDVLVLLVGFRAHGLRILRRLTAGHRFRRDASPIVGFRARIPCRNG